MEKDVIIIGAGAAGLMCGIEAGRRGRSVLIIDHSARTGNKIRISGGGRCNFTNLNIASEYYISRNSHFCKSALSRYRPDDFITLVKKHGIAFHEKESGQLFCDTSSSSIIKLLETECRQADVGFQYNSRIFEIKKENRFSVATERGTVHADSLVIATGGLSYPKTGASNFGMTIAEQFGIRTISPKPGLVPFTFSGAELEFCRNLSGISFAAEVSCSRRSFRGSVLFTHRGLSGPAILQISSYFNNGDIIAINMLPDIDAHELLLANRQSRKEIQNFLSNYLPLRFIHAWCSRYIKAKPLFQFNEKELKAAAEMLNSWKLKPSGTEGYASAEVTVGGIDTDEVSSKTMESKKVAGLYFIGEVLDVTGQLGGYNLHWAWASGHAAGQVV